MIGTGVKQGGDMNFVEERSDAAISCLCNVGHW